MKFADASIRKKKETVKRVEPDGDLLGLRKQFKVLERESLITLAKDNANYSMGIDTKTKDFLQTVSNEERAKQLSKVVQDLVNDNTARETPEDVKLLYINSKKRDQYLYPNPSSFSVTISEADLGITPNTASESRILTGITPTHVTMPFLSLTIRDGHNKLYIAETGNVGNGGYVLPTLWEQTVPPGVYTAEELVDRLNDLADSWSPITPSGLSKPIGLTPQASYLFQTNSPFQRYKWSYDPVSLLIMFSRVIEDILWETAPDGPGNTPYPRIHAPPFLLNPGPSSIARSQKESVEITNSYLINDSSRPNVLRINTAGTVHNIVFQNVVKRLAIASASNPNAFRYIKTDLGFYSNTPYSYNSYGSEWIEIEIDGVDAEWPFGTEATVGELVMYTFIDSLWPDLGFTYSIDGQETLTKITGIGNGDNLARTSHTFTTSAAVNFSPTDGTNIFVKSVPNAGDDTPHAVSVHTIGPYFSMLKTEFTIASEIVSPSATVSMRGFYRADSPLRILTRAGNQNVLLRLKIDGVTVGHMRNPNIVDAASSSEGPKIAFSWALSNLNTRNAIVSIPWRANFSTVSDVNDHTMGGSRADANLVPNKFAWGRSKQHTIGLEVVDDNGDFIDLDDLEWDIVLEFRFV